MFAVPQCAAVCRSVLQCSVDLNCGWCICASCVAVCCSVLLCVAVCCSVLQCVAVCCSVLQRGAECGSVMHCVECISTVDGIYVLSVLQRVSICCRVLQSVVV